MQEKAFA